MTRGAPRWTEQALAQYRATQARTVLPDPRQDAARETKADIQYERDLQRDCENLLSQRGIEYLHLSPRAREKRGWPDLVFSVRGRAYAVELKSATGRLSDAQKRCLTRMAGNGWMVRVVRDFETFSAILGGDTEAGAVF